MAFLDFLGLIANFAKEALPIARDVAGVVSAFSGDRGVPGLKQVKKGTKFSQALIEAALDPNDPRTRNLAAIFKERMMTDYLRGINDEERAYRRLRARGVVPGGIVPERRDEARTKAIAWGRANLGNVALRQAIETLLGGAGVNTQALGPLAQAFGPSVVSDTLSATRREGGISGTFDILDRLFGVPSSQLQSTAAFNTAVPGHFGGTVFETVDPRRRRPAVTG